MTRVAQRAHTGGRQPDSIFVVFDFLRKSNDHWFLLQHFLRSLSLWVRAKKIDYGLPFGEGEGFGCGGGSTFKLLRITSQAGASLAISRSDPIIDKWTSRSDMIR